MDLDSSLVLGLGSFGRILLACWLGGTISPLEFLAKIVAGPFLCVSYYPFRGIYGLEPSTCFGFLILLVKYFIAVFF